MWYSYPAILRWGGASWTYSSAHGHYGGWHANIAGIGTYVPGGSADTRAAHVWAVGGLGSQRPPGGSARETWEESSSLSGPVQYAVELRKRLAHLLFDALDGETGPLGDLSRTTDPLLMALRDGGAIRPDAAHLGIDVNGAGEVINRMLNIDASIVDNGSGAVTLVLNGSLGRGQGLETVGINLSGVNTYTGGTFVNAGNVLLNTAGANGTTTTALGTGNLTITGGLSTNGASLHERASVVRLLADIQAFAREF